MTTNIFEITFNDFFLLFFYFYYWEGATSMPNFFSISQHK